MVLGLFVSSKRRSVLMKKIYPITLFLLVVYGAGFSQQRALNQVVVPASLANKEKLDLKYTNYYTLGYEPLVGNGTLEPTSWDGFTDKIKLSVRLTMQFNNPTKYIIYKEGKGQVKTITGTPSGGVQLNALSVHVPVNYNGSPLKTMVFQFGFDKFNNLVSSEDIYIPASLIKGYEKAGTATKIAGGGREDAASFFKGLSFGIPSVSHFEYFHFDDNAVAEAGKLSDTELAIRKKEEADRLKKEEDLRKKQAAVAAAEAAKTAAATAPATGATGTAGRTTPANTATTSGSTRVAVTGTTTQLAELGKTQDGKYYRKKADNTYQQISSEEYQALKQQNAAIKNQSATAAAATQQQTNAQLLATTQQQGQNMVNNFQNQIAETQRISEERANLSMQTYYAAEAVRNGKQNLTDLASLSGNYSSVEELEAEFRQKYNSINQEVENLNQARDQQLQASYNSYALGADETGKAVGQAVVAVGGLINSFTADKEKREAKEALQRAKAQANAELVAKKKAMMLQLRNSFLAQFPDGGVPLSSHKVSVDELYFFSYIFDKTTLSAEQPVVAVSNVFPVARYGDGTWPFKTNVVAELRKSGAAGSVTLVGYYASKEVADQMRASFLRLSAKCTFSVKEIQYKGKKSSGKTGADFWGNGNKLAPTAAKDSVTTAPVIKKADDDDFWGGGAGKKVTKPETKKAVKKDDFWNN
jgi:hypothetical protein